MARKYRHPADIARENGWVVGTVLDGGPIVHGDVQAEPTRAIRITAIGEQSVLAVTFENNGEPCNWGESSYQFDCREWTVRSTPSEYISVRKAAVHLGCHENTVRNWMDQGLLVYKQFPSGHRRPTVESVQKMLEKSLGVSP